MCFQAVAIFAPKTLSQPHWAERRCPKQAEKQTQAGAEVSGVLASSVAAHGLIKATTSNCWQPGLQRLSQLLHVSDCTGKLLIPQGLTGRLFCQSTRGSLEAE